MRMSARKVLVVALLGGLAVLPHAPARHLGANGLMPGEYPHGAVRIAAVAPKGPTPQAHNLM